MSNSRCARFSAAKRAHRRPENRQSIETPASRRPEPHPARPGHSLSATAPSYTPHRGAAAPGVRNPQDGSAPALASYLPNRDCAELSRKRHYEVGRYLVQWTGSPPVLGKWSPANLHSIWDLRAVLPSISTPEVGRRW